MLFSSDQDGAAKIEELLEEARSGAESPGFMFIRISYMINGSPIRSQLKNLPVVLHFSSF